MMIQALAFLGREPDGQPQPHLKHWRELFAEREQRLYYVNDEARSCWVSGAFPVRLECLAAVFHCQVCSLLGAGAADGDSTACSEQAPCSLHSTAVSAVIANTACPPASRWATTPGLPRRTSDFRSGRWTRRCLVAFWDCRPVVRGHRKLPLALHGKPR